MALNDIIEVVCKVQAPSGDISLCRMHYAQSSGAGDASISEMPAIAVDFNTVLANAFINVLSISHSYGQTEVKIKTGASNSRFAVDSSSNGTAGGSNGTTGATERALVARKHTGVAGRRNQGRNFIPCPCLESFDDEGRYVPGNPDSANQAALLTALLQTVNSTVGGAAATFNLVIWHPAILTSTYVLTMTYSTLVGIQRRRRIGVGQ